VKSEVHWRYIISRTTVLIQPRQDLMPPGPCSVLTHEILEPKLAGRFVLPHPLQHLQLPGLSGAEKASS